MDPEPLSFDLQWDSELDPPENLALAPFVTKLGKCLGIGASHFDLMVSDDAEIRRMNKAYRNMDKTTDVLSFPTPAGTREGNVVLLGDIAISAPQARRQAEDIGHDLARELRFLVLHGVLHLLGYDHETDQGEMLAFQSELKQKLRPYFD